MHTGAFSQNCRIFFVAGGRKGLILQGRCKFVQEIHTVRLTSIHYWVPGNQNFCFAPSETIDGQVKKIRTPTCGMV